MLFTSGSFVVLVLATMVLFYLPPLRRWQTAILVLSSFVFYAVNAVDAKQPAYVLLLVLSIAINAAASYATIAVRRANGRLVVRVSDDGVGGADPDLGSGLRGLADRLAVIEGRLEIDSEPGKGTTITAKIPCG